MRRLIQSWLPPLAWMAVIFIFSAQPTLPSAPGRWDLLLKKGMHLLAYAVLTGLYLRALRGSGCHGARARYLSAGLALLYALSDEYHQTFVPGRNGNLTDVVVDALGIGLVMLLDWGRREAGEGSGQASG